MSHETENGPSGDTDFEGETVADPKPADELETIGPYQILGSLGKGGMGEVFIAKDPRLGRRVALKRIRADAQPESRRRFQREAKLAASLSHPSIVPVFDFVQLGDHEHLVMELIEGPSLRQWLDRGEHDLVQKLRLAEEIADGLAYAHHQGIIHRDLKTENVLISTEAHAKIADFGVARREMREGSTLVAGQPDASNPDFSELVTSEGAVIGTYRSMAPEQARGEAADARSDLFSFGVLLYEMFTGISPFRGKSPLETLFKLTQLPHQPAAELDPSLPPGLVRLIDHLLEKDRELRPSSANEVRQQLQTLRREVEQADEKTVFPSEQAAAGGPLPSPGRESGAKRRRPLWPVLLLAVLALAAIWWRFGRHATAAERTASGPLYAAVLAPRWEGAGNSAQAEELGQLSFLVRTAVLRRLSTLGGISPKLFEEVDQVPASTQATTTSYRQVAAAAGADEVLIPTVSCSGSDCSLRLERWRAHDDSVVGVENVELPFNNLPLASRAVQLTTRRLYGELEPRREETASFSPEAYSRLMAIQQELAKNPSSARLGPWLDELEGLRQKNPAFFEVALLEVEIAWRRSSETHDNALLERARNLMNAALVQAPEEPEVLLRAAWLASLDGRPKDAETYVQSADRVAPGDLRVVDYRALLLERQGKLEEALELRRHAAKQRPSWNRAYNLAFTLIRLSRWQEASQILDKLLAKAPELGRALSLRARAELSGGDPQKAVELYETLLARSDNLIDRYNLATAHLLLGNGASSAKEIEKALAVQPDHPFYLLALGEARSLEGREAEAQKIFRRVAKAPEGEHKWESLSVQAQAHARLGHKERAIELLQEALQLAPGYDGQVAFEAALIYSLVGDRTAALVNLRKAVAAGKGGWLRLPAFAVWRDDPEIGPLLAEAQKGLRGEAQRAQFSSSSP